jgi:hypothetical protein
MHLHKDSINSRKGNANLRKDLAAFRKGNIKYCK